MAKIYIQKNPIFYNKIVWVMTLISQYTGKKYEFSDRQGDADISISCDASGDIKIDEGFFVKLNSNITSWRELMPNCPTYLYENAEKGVLETIFYLVNCIQELNPKPEDLDHYGRYKYTASLQYHYGIIEENLVSTLIDELVMKFPILSSDGKLPKNKSKIFISHDIDLLRSGWKVEGYLALKSLNFRLLFKVIKDMILGKSFYNNIDDVIGLDDQYGMKASFYLLPKMGKDKNGIMNAEYPISDLVHIAFKIQNSGHDIGIHKSSFESNFKEELSLFPSNVHHNRYHFLKFQTHEAWKVIESSELKTDASLGFAEHIGFRNSYGLPFVPFDIENDRPYNFVEVPLHVMDGTLKYYMELHPKEAEERVKIFLQKNNKNTVLSILWHNDQMLEYSHNNNKKIFSSVLECIKKYHLFTPISIGEISNNYNSNSSSSN